MTKKNRQTDAWVNNRVRRYTVLTFSFIATLFGIWVLVMGELALLKVVEETTKEEAAILIFVGTFLTLLFGIGFYSESLLPKPKIKALAWMWSPITEIPIIAGIRLYKQALLFFLSLSLIAAIVTSLSLVIFA